MALAGAVFASPVGAQASQGARGTATVSGQINILERPGETTDDLGDVVVYLEPIGATVRSKPAAPTYSVMNLQSRQFRPRVSVVTEGSRVTFANQDAFSHNVFSKANGGFDTNVFGRGRTRDNLFRDAGVYPLYCNVHPRMTAYVVTVKTPYFVLAGLDGRFSIDSVPAGQYEMHVWHDRTDAVTRGVTVPSTGIAGVRVELDAR